MLYIPIYILYPAKKIRNAPPWGIYGERGPEAPFESVTRRDAPTVSMRWFPEGSHIRVYGRTY